MADPLFKPLPGAARTPTTARAKPAGWAVIAPVPTDAPPPPASHPKRGTPARIETYRDAAGAVLGHVLRFDLAGGGKEFLPLTYCRHEPTGHRAWRWKSWPVPRPLYGLDRLAARPDAPVILAEGEKAADAAGELIPDHVAITTPNGSAGAGKADWSPLAGRQIVIWPDADDPGRKYADAAVRALQSVAAGIAIIAPPEGVAEGWDAADALAEGWTPAQAHELVAAARLAPGPAADAAPSSPGAPDPAGGRRRRPKQSDDILDLAADAELWHSPDREAHATVPVSDHVENWPVRSKGFKLWVSGRFFAKHTGAPSAQAVEDGLRVLEAIAIHDGPEYTPFTRIGRHERAAYLDLVNERWQAIKITPAGWQIIDRPPLKFLRSAAMRALPIPERNGSIEDLRPFINARGDDDFKLFLAWLVGAFNPRGPYPILVLGGEQGSGKSILSRLARALIDPNTAPIRSAPRDEQNLLVAAKNSWTIVLDNLSEVQPWLSDAFCRLSTGGGFSARALYSDWEEIVFQAQRPIILNGIPDLAGRADLADRCIHLVLPALGDAGRETEAEFWHAFAAARPAILGVLLDAVAGALARLAGVSFNGHAPRMADFARWMVAAEPALGWQDGEFLDLYGRARQGAIETTLEQDVIADAVRALAAEGDWQGTPTELLEALEKFVKEAVRKSRRWPAVTKLRSRLRRLQSPLRAFGIELELDRRAGDKANNRFIGIHRQRQPETD